MKTLYGAIAKNIGIGAEFYRRKISEVLGGRKFFGSPFITFPDVDFKNFIYSVSVDDFAAILYECWQRSKREFDSGTINIVLKDGVLLINITKFNFRGSLNKNSTWWREMFLRPGQMKSSAIAERIYNHPDISEKLAKEGCCSFTSEHGERLKKILPKYLEYLKEHYDTLVNT